MYHSIISRKLYNTIEDLSFINVNQSRINKSRINYIINKMITQEEKYEDYYIYKDIFTKLYNDISEIDNIPVDISQSNIDPSNYEIAEEDYKYFKTTCVKNKKIIDIMIKK